VIVARCSCGKRRRHKAAVCQSCLDSIEAEQRAKAPPTRWARHWRSDGWLCVFREGQVILTPLMKADGAIAYTTAIDNGRWAYAVSVLEQPWRMLSTAEYSELAPLFAAIRRDCYCSSFPDTGCDFCNGTRLPDGAKEAT
jgi:hypothetical protein